MKPTLSSAPAPTVAASWVKSAPVEVRHPAAVATLRKTPSPPRALQVSPIRNLSPAQRYESLPPQPLAVAPRPNASPHNGTGKIKQGATQCKPAAKKSSPSRVSPPRPVTKASSPVRPSATRNAQLQKPQPEQPRTRTAEMLAQAGALNTAPLQNYGPCGCQHHDAPEALLTDTWILKFLEFSKKRRVDDRLFDLEPVLVSSSNDATKRRRLPGAWCCVDSLAKKRADVLPPKRYMMVCKTPRSLGAPSAELLLFPDEALDSETGLVRSVPCASFSLTPRAVSSHDAADGQVGAITVARLRLGARKYHIVIEVVCIPLAPLVAEATRRISHKSQVAFSQACPADGAVCLDAVLQFLEESDVAADGGSLSEKAASAGISIVGGAAFGLFDATQFFELLGDMLEITNESNTLLASRLREIFSPGSACKDAQRLPLVESQLRELFAALRSPLTGPQYRIPLSVWDYNVDKIACVLESQLSSQRDTVTLEELTFQDGPRPLAFDTFGTIKSAMHKKTQIFYDVRCLPLSKTHLALPQTLEATRATCEGDTALLMEYVSRFPFVQRVHAVLADASRYYVVLPPLLTRQALGGDALRTEERGVEYMILSDAAQRSTTFRRPQHHFDMVRKVAAQLILSVSLVHSRGLVVGSITPRGVLCKVTNSAGPRSTIETMLTGIGVTSVSASWLRQQRGTLEYLSPAFLSHFLDTPQDRAAPTFGVADDWWGVGCVIFELFSKGVKLFPLPSAQSGDKRQHTQQWSGLLFSEEGLNLETADAKDLLELSSEFVFEHLANCLSNVSDTIQRDWLSSRSAAEGKYSTAASAQTAQSSRSCSNLAARRVEERKHMSSRPSSEASSPCRSYDAAWTQSCDELLGVLKVLLDVRNFSAPPPTPSPCASGFHSFALKIMSLPFFATVDWVQLFEQSKESMTLAGPLLARSSSADGRSVSSESRNRRATSPGSAPSHTKAPLHKPASSPKLHSKQKSNVASCGPNAGALDNSQQFDCGSDAAAAIGRVVNPFSLYSAEEAALLVDVLGGKGSGLDKQLADEARRLDYRLKSRPVHQIPEVVHQTGFLAATASFKMYKRAVQETVKQRQTEPATITKPAEVPTQRPQSPHKSAMVNLSTTSAAQLISPLHHSYVFQRPKGFIDLVTEKRVGAVYDAPPVRSQGDVSAFTKSLMSAQSRRLTASRRAGYLDELPDHGKGQYERPKPLPPTFGDPPPLPAAVSAAARLANANTRKLVWAAPAEQQHVAPLISVGQAIPVAVTFSPVVTQPSETPNNVSRQLQGNLTVSPETPRDPAAVLFASPVGDRSAASQRSAVPFSDDVASPRRPSGRTPISRPAMKLPPKQQESDESSSGSVPQPQASTAAVRESTPDPVVAAGGKRPAMRIVRRQRGPQSEPVAAPMPVASVRGQTAGREQLREPAPRVSSSNVQRPPTGAQSVVHQRPRTASLGHWEKSESDDESPRTAGGSARRKSGAQQTNRVGAKAHTVPAAAAIAAASRPPPQHDLYDDDDDDAQFS